MLHRSEHHYEGARNHRTGRPAAGIGHRRHLVHPAGVIPRKLRHKFDETRQGQSDNILSERRAEFDGQSERLSETSPKKTVDDFKKLTNHSIVLISRSISQTTSTTNSSTRKTWSTKYVAKIRSSSKSTALIWAWCCRLRKKKANVWKNDTPFSILTVPSPNWKGKGNFTLLFWRFLQVSPLFEWKNSIANFIELLL